MRTIPALLAAASLLAVSSTLVHADEFSDAMGRAQTAYTEGKFTDAKKELETASTIVMKKNAERLMPFLPAAKEGWAVKDEDPNAAGSSILGGGAMTQRTYSKSDGSGNVQITVMSDSPMLGMAAMFSNPEMAKMAGMNVQMVGTQPVMIEENGDVSIAVGSRFFVTVSGNATPEEKLAYASAIDFPGLKAFQ